MKVHSTFDVPLTVYDPEMPPRAPGLHVSTIIKALAEDLYPKWFGKYPPDEQRRHVTYFEDGLIGEHVWGQSMQAMIGAPFSRPVPQQAPTTVPSVSCGACAGRGVHTQATPEELTAIKGVILEKRPDLVCQACGGSGKEGIWCSADGYVFPGTPAPEMWQPEYPAWTSPAIHECKVTRKSCSQTTSPFVWPDGAKAGQVNEKFLTWLWQVQAYCYVWKCHTAFIEVFHQLGDYKERPWRPMAAIHRIDFTAPELAAHWKWLVDEAKERGLFDDSGRRPAGLAAPRQTA